MYKIRIIHIDDEPTDGLLEDGQLKVHQKSNSTYSHIPNFEKYFEICWIRTTEDAKRYLDYYQNLEDVKGSLYAGTHSFIPEIVSFDYSLDKGRSIAEFLEIVDYPEAPFLKTKSTLQELGMLKKTDILDDYQPEFDLSVFADDSKRFDLFGVLIGGLILKQFKFHPSVGIPTTQRTTKDVEGTYAEVFEWLINYGIKDIFASKHRQAPQWDALLTFAISNLRNRITLLVKSSKIQPNLPQLIQLSTVEGIAKLDGDNERSFTFTSIYGERSLPLEGLFIDKNEGEERDNAIAEWAGELLNITLAGQSIQEIKDAEIIVSRLWSAYRSGLMKQRYKFSYLETQHELAISEGGKLNEGSDRMRTELRDFYKITGADGSERICEEHTIELRKKDISAKSAFTRRLVVFFMAIRLWEQYYQSIKMLDNPETHESFKEKKFKALISEPPTQRDLIALLYPVPSEPIKLPIHKADEDNNGDKIRTHLRDIIGFNKKNGFDGKGDIIANLGKIISKQEIFFVKDYASRFNLPEFITNENGEQVANEYYPTWLKKI